MADEEEEGEDAGEEAEDKPRLTPRDWIVENKSFGKVAAAEWHHVDPEEKSALAEAYYQHRVACAVYDALTMAGRSIDDFAVEVGVTPETLRRKLRGESRASMGDYINWASKLGADILPVVQDTKWFLPRKHRWNKTAAEEEEYLAEKDKEAAEAKAKAEKAQRAKAKADQR